MNVKTKIRTYGKKRVIKERLMIEMNVIVMQ